MCRNITIRQIQMIRIINHNTLNFFLTVIFHSNDIIHITSKRNKVRMQAKAPCIERPAFIRMW